MEELSTVYTEYNTLPVIIFGALAYVTKILVKDIHDTDETKYKE